MIEPTTQPVIPDPYDDDYKAVLASFRRLPLDEQTKLLQEIGIIGPDGRLAPAYADEEGSGDA